MLSESDRRALNAVFPEFHEAFNAKDAAIYMEMCCIFTADESQRIEDQKSTLAALREFYRTYSRKADGLDKIEEYLKKSMQENLIEFLDKARCFNDNPSCSSVSRRVVSREERHRILVKGQAPLPRNLVTRPKEATNLRNILRQKDEYNNGFFVVLHGLPGCGKTSLVSQVLADTDLIGNEFDSVCFLVDGGDVRTLFYDLWVMLRHDNVLAPPPLDLSQTALRKLITDALIDHPNLLVVLDDVTQVEVLRDAERLGLRVLATTRYRSLFDAVDSCMDFIPIYGMTLEETQGLLLANGFKEQDKKLLEDFGKAHTVTSANPAQLLKMTKMARGSVASLLHLCNAQMRSGVSVIDCVSSYRHKSLHTPFSEAVMRLESVNRNALACASVLPPDQWIPLGVWERVIPIDVCETDEIYEEIRRQLRSLEDNGSWVVESEDGQSFKVPSIVHQYLQEAVEDDTRKGLYASLELAYSTLQSVQGRLDEQQQALKDFFTVNADRFQFTGKQESLSTRIYNLTFGSAV